MAERLLAGILAALMIGSPSALFAGLATPDEDGDAVDAAIDNCRLVPNPAPVNCDTDMDGYGNACDCDFDNDGDCDVADFGQFRQQFQGNVPIPPGMTADSDCDGDIDIADFGRWRQGFQGAPGTLDSGLTCAGTIPCP